MQTIDAEGQVVSESVVGPDSIPENEDPFEKAARIAREHQAQRKVDARDLSGMAQADADVVNAGRLLFDFFTSPMSQAEEDLYDVEDGA